MADETHNRAILLLVGLITLTCVTCATYLSLHGKDYAALLTIAGSAIGVLTGSAIKNTPTTSTTIPDSTGVINVTTGQQPTPPVSPVLEAGTGSTP